MSFSEAPIIELDFIDSTNNYAMKMIDGNNAQQGTTIVAKGQTNGKGQRGKIWLDTPGDSLLMSVIVCPRHQLTEQFLFNAAITVAIANVLQKLDNSWQVHIKWPNDIIVNDKKAGGILIENVLRGSSWTHSVIGLGLNVLQSKFPDELPFATSLKIASGKTFDLYSLLIEIRGQIVTSVLHTPGVEQMYAYNNLLFKRGKQQVFIEGGDRWSGTVLNALPNGTLQVQLDNRVIIPIQHGQVIWEYSI